MQLTLVLPGLIARCANTGADTAATHAPALAHLIAMAGTPRREEGGTAAALAARYGVTRQTDWPLAPLRLAALGVDPEAAYWLAADPVTLEVGRADVSLAGIVADLARADADAMLATLNAHFAADGLTFVAPRPDAFFVRAATTDASRHALPRRGARPSDAGDASARRGRASLAPLAIGSRDAAARAPGQSRAGTCRTPAGEQPVVLRRRNAAAATGRPRRRSARTPRPTSPRRSRTSSEQPARPPRAHLDATLLDAGTTESIVVVLEGALEIAALERSWAAPARDALARGSLREVTVLCDDAGDAVIWRAERPGPWQRLIGRYRTHDLAALLDAAEKNR